MENFFFVLELAIVLVSDFSDTLGEAGFFLSNFSKWGGGVIKVLSESLDFFPEWFDLCG